MISANEADGILQKYWNSFGNIDISEFHDFIDFKKYWNSSGNIEISANEADRSLQ